MDACNHGMMLAKSWAFLSNSPEIQHLGCLCPHAERHESIAGKRNSDGVFISTLTAEYPLSPARHIIRQVWSLAPVWGKSRCLRETNFGIALSRTRPCDGAGLWSTADHTLAQESSPLRAVAEAWLAWATHPRCRHGWLRTSPSESLSRRSLPPKRMGRPASSLRHWGCHPRNHFYQTRARTSASLPECSER